MKLKHFKIILLGLAFAVLSPHAHSMLRLDCKVSTEPSFRVLMNLMRSKDEGLYDLIKFPKGQTIMWQGAYKGLKIKDLHKPEVVGGEATVSLWFDGGKYKLEFDRVTDLKTGVWIKSTRDKNGKTKEERTDIKCKGYSKP